MSTPYVNKIKFILSYSPRAKALCPLSYETVSVPDVENAVRLPIPSGRNDTLHRRRYSQVFTRSFG